MRCRSDQESVPKRSHTVALERFAVFRCEMTAFALRSAIHQVNIPGGDWFVDSPILMKSGVVLKGRYGY